MNTIKFITSVYKISKFSEIAGYEIEIQKATVFLYICNEKFQKEIKKTILLVIASKTIKYLGINLTKEM